MNSEIRTISIKIDMRIKFSEDQKLLLDKHEIISDSADNTPVIVDDIPVGIISDMWVHNSNLYCEVRCIIWTRFLDRFVGKDFGVTLYMDDTQEVTVMSIDSIK